MDATKFENELLKAALQGSAVVVSPTTDGRIGVYVSYQGPSGIQDMKAAFFDMIEGDAAEIAKATGSDDVHYIEIPPFHVSSDSDHQHRQFDIAAALYAAWMGGEARFFDYLCSEIPNGDFGAGPVLDAVILAHTGEKLVTNAAYAVWDDFSEWVGALQLSPDAEANRFGAMLKTGAEHFANHDIYGNLLDEDGNEVDEEEADKDDDDQDEDVGMHA